MLAIVPPAGSCHISHRQNSQISFPLSSTRLIVNLNLPSPLTFRFFPRYTILQFAQTFWGKAVTACQSKHRSSARWTQRAGGISPGRNLPTSSASAGPPSGKPSLPCVRTAPPIEAITNRGYALPHGADLLNADAITALLAPAVAQAVQITVVDRLPGTNAALRTQATNGAPEGLVLIAQAQSAGRGRRGHSFFSPPGGLYLSILLRPAFSTRQSPQITALAAVAAARAAEQLCGTPIQIKWVNDLWKNGKKVCGILTEAAVDLESGMLDYAVLGLGFNLVQPSGGWPKELAAVAGSLFDSAPAPGARAALAAAFLNEFWALYHTGLRGSWLDDYRRRQALTGRHVTLIPNGSEPRGATVLGIDDDCRLLVRCDGDLAPTAFGSDEIRVIPELGALA